MSAIRASSSPRLNSTVTFPPVATRKERLVTFFDLPAPLPLALLDWPDVWRTALAASVTVNPSVTTRLARADCSAGS